jgi:hypothetical protein
MQKTLRKLLLALVLCSFLIVIPLVMAEEASVAEAQTTTEVDNSPKPAPLIFLLGAGAIIIVGAVMIARNNFRGDVSK